MFEIEIRLYASLKDKAGSGRIHVQLSEPATVVLLRAAIITSHPMLADGLRSAIVSVNRNFAADDTPIQPTDELAIFPPVSGGSGLPHPTYFALAAESPDLNAIHAHLRQAEVGAIITFSGYVRGQTQRDGLPTATTQLNYEAYEEMAHEKMSQIAHEIWAQWPLVRGIAIVQRIGRLEVGEPTTLVACAAGHRDQGAFEAARYGIDRLKEIVPVWKQEVGADHSVWVEGDYRPTTADN
jgi:molybdopterin synthase catalytic subunit